MFFKDEKEPKITYTGEQWGRGLSAVPSFYYLNSNNNEKSNPLNQSNLLHRDIVKFYEFERQRTWDEYNKLMVPLINLYNQVKNSTLASLSNVDLTRSDFLRNFNWGDWQKAMMLKWFFKYGNPFVQGYRDVSSSRALQIDAFLNKPVSAIRDYQASYIDPELMEAFVRSLLGGRYSNY